MRRHLVLAAIAASALACSSPTGGIDNPLNPTDSGGDGVSSDSDTGGTPLDTDGLPETPSLFQYALSPDNAVLKNDTAGGAPVLATQSYKQTKTDGTAVVDVTDTTTFSVDDATVGSFTKNVFTCAALPVGVLGKSTNIHGQPGNAPGKITCIQLKVTGDKRDFFFSVPYMEKPDPAKDILKFGTNIKQVDVGFIEDTTASMGPEINNLRDSLSTIIANLKTAIPNVGLAVARHDDFPVSPFGYDGSAGGASDIPFLLLQPVTTSEAAAKSAVATLVPYRGGILPESQYEAQYQMLTGEGLTWTVAKAGTIDKHVPKPGTSGGADWRAGSLPVVVEITDASWNDKEAYATKGLVTHGKADVVKAYGDYKAKYVGIQAIVEKSGGGIDTPCTTYTTASCDSAYGYTQGLALATATGSVVDPTVFGATCAAGKCCTGIAGAAVAPDATGKCPLVYQAKSDGTGVADSVVKAIQAISVGSLFDVTAVPRNDPSNLDVFGVPVDATKFILNIRAMKEGSAKDGCPAHAATTPSSASTSERLCASR